VLVVWTVTVSWYLNGGQRLKLLARDRLGHRLRSIGDATMRLRIGIPWAFVIVGVSLRVIAFRLAGFTRRTVQEGLKLARWWQPGSLAIGRRLPG